MFKIDSNLMNVLIVGILVSGFLLFVRELTGCENSTQRNILSCVESNGDPYLCCINHSASRDLKECEDKEKDRKVREFVKPRD